MIFKARKGQTSYGEVIGILMLDTNTPFIQGDVGNAASYGYPVRFKRIDGLTPSRIFEHDRSFVQAMIAGAQELEREGVRAITGDCGFMAIYQHEVQEAVDIPVFLTSLLQIPFITSIIKPSSQVGVLTANSQALTREMLLYLGINNPDRVVVAGLEDTECFKKTAIDDVGLLDTEGVRTEVVQSAQDLQRRNPSLGAMLLECSMLPPYAADVQESIELPVFDYLSMIDHLAASLIKKRFPESL